MSDFEYLANISIGQYLPLSSFLHQRDPRAKLLGIALLVISITIARSLTGTAIGLAVVLMLTTLSRVPFKYVLRSIRKPLPFLLLLAILQVFITLHTVDSQPVYQILGVSIFWAGLKAAILLLLKFFGLIALFSVSSASISTLELIHGLDLLLKPLRVLGFKPDAASMTLQVTFRFVPFLAINAERIAKSQASRGAEWGGGRVNLAQRVRQVIPLLIPLFNNSLQQAEILADAMTARGFESGKPRSSMTEYSFGLMDTGFLLVCLAAAYLTAFPVYLI